MKCLADLGRSTRIESPETGDGECLFPSLTFPVRQERWHAYSRALSLLPIAELTFPQANAYLKTPTSSRPDPSFSDLLDMAIVYSATERHDIKRLHMLPRHTVSRSVSSSDRRLDLSADISVSEFKALS